MIRPGVVLASASPRRRDLLESLGWKFDIAVSDMEELFLAGEYPVDSARRLAREKLMSVAPNFPDKLVIAADTLVTIDSSVLGKPSDRKEAEQMLSILSGRIHKVVTGLAVSFEDNVIVDAEVTSVEFRDLSKSEIRAYADTGEGTDKAGAYAIQGRGSILVRKVTGCYFNVVGLPLYLLSDMLMRLGITLEDQWRFCE